jgi:hypothetical protein
VLWDRWWRVNRCGVVDTRGELKGRVSLDRIADGDYGSLVSGLLASNACFDGCRRFSLSLLHAQSSEDVICEIVRTKRSHCGRRPGVGGR